MAALTVAAILAGCGGQDEPVTTSVTLPPATTSTVPAEPPPADGSDPVPGDASGDREDGRSTGPAEGPTADPRETELERDAERTVRAYIEGLAGRDGAAVCALLAPAALDQIDLPRARGGCAESLAASIGYRDPRGLPVWEGARIAAVQSIEVGGAGTTAKLVVTVVTDFADRPDPSIEEDVVYLIRSGERWLVAQPSTTLYRAVGIADVPPSAISPPN